MDHTPGQGQFNEKTFMAASLQEGKTKAQATEEFLKLISRPKIDGELLQALVDLAIEKGIPVASHDDDTVEKVDEMYSLGVRICEFPINLQTAQHATNMGMHVIGGASNILRGGSLSGNANMKEAVLNGWVDTLCSDYYPPAILHSVFKLHQEEDLSLPQAVKLATLHPAKAAGIDAFTGSIEVGKAADILIINIIDSIPMVNYTIVNGHVVSHATVKADHKKLQSQF